MRACFVCERLLAVVHREFRVGCASCKLESLGFRLTVPGLITLTPWGRVASYLILRPLERPVGTELCVAISAPSIAVTNVALLVSAR